MKKLILTTIISFVCIIGITLANDVDCNNAKIDENGHFKFIQLDKYSHILPNEAMEKAYENLRSACCKSGVLNGNQCEGYDSNAIFPESLYLFDHLLDIYLRRLDAKQGDENGGDLIYGLAPDPVGQEWKEFMYEIANDSDGTPPTMINEKYKKFWKGTVYFEKYSNADIQINTAPWLENIENKAQNYVDWTLADRYNNACNIVMMMYIKIIDPVTSWNGQYTDTSAIQAKLLSIYNSCMALVNDRINAERVYTEAIMQQKGSVFLDDTLNAYLNTYFIENKLYSLRDKIFNRCAMFKEVVKSVNKLVKNCS